MAYAACAANAVVVDRAAFAFPRADLFRYSAKWWSYLVPPVGHSLLGATAQRVWDAVDVREGVLVALAAGEYAVSPSALWRDVLPSAHRWVTRQPGRVRALDCVPLNQESESVQWLTGQRVTLLGSSTSDCTEPNLPRKLAATGYTHLLVRRDTADGQWFAAHPAPDGLRVAARFDGEHNAEWSWRWMGADAAWTIVNTGARPIVAAVGIENVGVPPGAPHGVAELRRDLLDGNDRALRRNRARRRRDGSCAQSRSCSWIATFRPCGGTATCWRPSSSNLNAGVEYSSPRRSEVWSARASD